MKNKISSRFLILVALMFLFRVSFAQEKESHISFTTWNHHAEITNGVWFGSIQKEGVCIQLMDSKNRNSPSFIINYCIPEEDFTIGNDEGFELKKPVGTIKFSGAYPNEKGQGEFTFTKNKDFVAFLNKEGINTDSDDRYYYFKLFLGSVSEDYVLGLKKEGYHPTLRQLGKLAIHDVGLDYIRSIGSTNYKGLELDMLIKFAIHDVSVDFIKDLESAGYGDLDANMIKTFAVHEIDIDYIKSLSDIGYAKMDPNMLKSFAVHDITLDYIQDLTDVGYGNLEADMLKKFAVHNIEADYIRSLKKTGITTPDASVLKKAKVHNLKAHDIERAMANGHDSKDLSDYIKIMIRGK